MGLRATITQPGLFWTFTRFCISGGMGALFFVGFSFLANYIWVDAGWPRGPAQTSTATVIGVLGSNFFQFFMNKHFTFLAGDSGEAKREFTIFVLTRSVSNLFIYLFLMNLFVHEFGFSFLGAVLLAGPIGILINFPVERIIAFRKGKA